MQGNSTPTSRSDKPAKPNESFPLFAHATRRWCKKIRGKLVYFGPWEDPDGALQRYLDFVAGKTEPTPRKNRKPAKPYPDFPLFAHATRRWCKKIRGKLVYFGPWEDPDGALDRYLRDKDDLHAGRTPRPEAGTVRVKDVANAYLVAKDQALAAGELALITRKEYQRVADEMVACFGAQRLAADLGPEDFSRLRERVAGRSGVYVVRKVVQTVRSIFKFAYESGLIEKPMRFGPAFKKPSQKTIRQHRAAQGQNLFTADEVRRLIDAAGVPLKAIILLGINAGFGNSDCGKLPLAALDLDGGWVTYPRPKTGIARRCKLWPETVRAIRAAIAARPTPKDPAHAGLVFITVFGLPWGKDIADSPVTKETAKLLAKLHINGRNRLGYYSLRRTYRTIADETTDQAACDYTMGHEVPHMSSIYRQRIDDSRLIAVAEHVRKWLFGSPERKEGGEA